VGFVGWKVGAKFIVGILG